VIESALRVADMVTMVFLILEFKKKLKTTVTEVTDF
jgi:hypothetical protein